MPAVIEVEGLVKEYGQLRAVDGIDFTVDAGEVFAFLGPNGAGKTTTVEILETLRARTSGEARVLGMDVGRQARRVRERIGVLPQDFRAYDALTCRENVRYFAALFKARPDVDELLALVGLTDKANARYDTLSGGLQQRLGVAISLVNDPEVIFLDEPTTGLDPRARRELWSAVQGLRDEGKTVFLTTHYMEEAHVLADRVAVIHHGRIVALDAPDKLIAKHAPGQHVIVRGGAHLVDRLPYASKITNGDLRVHVNNGDELGNVLARLGKNGGFVGLEVRTPTLEDVFLSLTGETIEQAEAELQAAAPRTGGGS